MNEVNKNMSIKNTNSLVSYSLLYNIEMSCYGNRIWFYSQNTGIVMEVDALTGEIRVLFSVSDQDRVPYRSILYFDGKLYLLPFRSNTIIIYDIENGLLTNNQIERKEEFCYITGGIEKDGHIYMFGNKKPMIYEFDVVRKMCIKWEIEELKKQREIGNYFWTDAIEDESQIILPVLDGGILNFNPPNNHIFFSVGKIKCDLVFVGIGENDIHCIYITKEKQVLMSTYGFDGTEKGKINVEFDDNWTEYPFIKAIYRQGAWYTFPFKKGSICKIYEKNGKIEKLADFSEGEEDEELFGGMIILDNGVLCTINQVSGELVYIEIENNKVRRNKIYINSRELNCFQKAIWRSISSKKDLIEEKKSYYTLDNFLNSIIL